MTDADFGAGASDDDEKDADSSAAGGGQIIGPVLGPLQYPSSNQPETVELDWRRKEGGSKSYKQLQKM